LKKVKKNKVVEFFKPTKKKIIRSSYLFGLFLLFLPVITFFGESYTAHGDSSVKIISERLPLVAILDHVLTYGFKETNFSSIIRFVPFMILSIPAILYFIFAYLISCFLIAKKEFFRPTKYKLIIFGLGALSLLILFTTNDMKFYYPPSIIALGLLFLFRKIDPLVSQIGDVAISFIVWYLMACFIIYLYNKFEFFKISKKIFITDLIISLLLLLGYMRYLIIFHSVSLSVIKDLLTYTGLLLFITEFFIIYLMSCVFYYIYKKLKMDNKNKKLMGGGK